MTHMENFLVCHLFSCFTTSHQQDAYWDHPQAACTVMELGTWMQASDMSASRGLSELHELGFLTYETAGATRKSKRYLRNDNIEYIEKGRSFLTNPVMKTLWVRKSDLYSQMPNLPLAGLDALAKKAT